jgi:hypothetical protein
LRPDATYTVEVHVAGFGPVRKTFRAPAAGLEHRETIRLAPEEGPERALALRLVTESGTDADVSEIDVRLLSPSDGTETSRAGLRAKERRFVWSDAPPGRHRALVTSAGIFIGGAVPWLDAEADVSVPETGTSEATVRLSLGGWLVLSARAPDGRLLPARCRVLDAAGASRVRYLVVRDDEGGGSMGHSGALSEEGPAQVEPPLPPGTYTVEVEHDAFASKRVEAVVKKGETTTLEVPLLAR